MMRPYEKQTIAAAVKAILLATPAISPVFAQDAGKSEELQEVVVAAQKYLPEDQTTATGLAMPLIDTPQSISIVSQDMLRLFDASSAYEAADLVPGASQGLNGFGTQQLLIRGQNVVPRVNAMTSVSPQFLDSFALDRLEVVRGPATVLYGVTGAFGGEVNQILKKPTDQFHLDVGYINGDFASRRLQADVSGPVPGTEDRLKIRVVTAYTNYGIPQYTAVAPNNIDKFGSVAVTYDFTPSTTASLYAYKQEKSFDPTDGCPMAQTATGELYIPTSIPIDHWYCNDPSFANTTTINTYEYVELTHKFANDWTFHANEAHSKATSTLDYVWGNGPAGSGTLPPEDVELYSYHDVADAAVVTSDLSLGGKFDFLGRTHEFFAAAQYQKQPSNTYHAPGAQLGLMNMFQDGGLGILANGSPIPAIPAPQYARDLYGNDVSVMGSVQILLHPTDRWDVLAGVLVQHIDVTSNSYVYAGGSTYGNLKETDTIPRLGVTYGLLPSKGEVLNDAKAYFSYSEGVLPNVGIFAADGSPLTAPQKMRSYEVGLKTSWFNGNVDGSVAVFDSYVTNLPSTIFDGVGGIGTFSQVLGGKNTYRGVEFQVIGEIVKGWNVDLNYSYLRALEQTTLIPEELSVANVPRQQASLFTSYEFIQGPLHGLLGGIGIIRKDDVPIMDNPSFIQSGGYDPSNQLPWSATLFDFRLSYKGFSGSLKGLEFFGNVYNAFNARTYSGQGTAQFTDQVGPPRTMTAGIRYTF
jgi:iron complex outermembrane recepter protein